MLLSFLIIASGWWHIRAAYGSDSCQFYISKPLTMTAHTPGSCSGFACRWPGTCC